MREPNTTDIPLPPPVASAPPRWTRALGAFGIALMGGLFLGGLTSYGQTVLPDALRPFANSSGGWTMLAFLLVWLSGARPALAAVLGIVAFEALVEGYGIVSLSRGYFYADPFSGIFSLIGLLCGPVLGFASSLARHGTARWATLGVTPLVAVLWGEGVFGLTMIADTTGVTYWILELVLGTVFLGLAVIRRRPSARVLLVACALSAVGGVVFYAVYSRL